jgi:hypothetical protein
MWEVHIEMALWQREHDDVGRTDMPGEGSVSDTCEGRNDIKGVDYMR